ncbi:hypothetical protein BJF83_22155 [Nocardiopsis sp. CNR-923]|nr:hypothetical protein BJF83_22155 [Nocardiopsis sp. CNR-923]
MVGPNLPADLHARSTGQPHVQHGDVRQHHRDPGERLLRGPRLADHGHVVLGLQERRHTTADHLVVVHEEDPDPLPSVLGSAARHPPIPILCLAGQTPLRPRP